MFSSFSYILTESNEPAIKKHSAKKFTPTLSTSWRGNYGRMKNPSHRLTNYHGPYPQIVLESARFELLKLIDMREGHGYNKLKMKCGIYPDGSRDVDFDGWGDASDYFSCSGEPEKYLQDFDFDPSFSSRMNGPNFRSCVKSVTASAKSSGFSCRLNAANSPVEISGKGDADVKSKGKRKSVPVATVTFEESEVSDTEETSSDSCSDTNAAETNKHTDEDVRMVTVSNNIGNKTNNLNANIAGHNESVQGGDTNVAEINKHTDKEIKQLTDSNNLEDEINDSNANVAEHNKPEHEENGKSEETTARSVENNGKSSQHDENDVSKPETNGVNDNVKEKNVNVSKEIGSIEVNGKNVINKPETTVVNDNDERKIVSVSKASGSVEVNNVEDILNRSVIILESDENDMTENSPIFIDESFIEAGSVDNVTPSNSANSPVEIADSSDSSEEKQSNNHTAEKDPIIVDESFIEARMVDTMPSNNANSPVEIVDSADSSEEIQSNGSEMIVDLADSVGSDGAETNSEGDGTSVKRKHIELDNYELEEGEIISSDEDEDVEYIGKSLKPSNITVDEGKPKKQKVSNFESSSSMRDPENNIQRPMNFSRFKIDRRPTAVNWPHVDSNHNDNAQMNKDIVVKDDKINANIPEASTNSAENKMLEKRFKCDYCPTVSAKKEKMLKHLQDAKHYSSSYILVNENGKPIQIVQKTGPKCFEAAFKGPIPICPEPYCSKIFRDIYSCVFHCRKLHNKEEPAYALAELLGEDVIPCKRDAYDCDICGVHCLSSRELFQHRKIEKHVTINPRPDSQTVYLCCDCNETFCNLNEVLKHRTKSNNHFSDVRVLHISFTRRKKKLLPFDGVPVTGLSAVETEISYLQALNICNTTNKTRRQITARIRDLSTLLR